MIDEEAIARDISAFRDPATQIDVKKGGGFLEIQIVRDQALRRYLVEIGTGRIERRDSAKGKLDRFASFASLLASDEFASLSSFSATSKRIVEQELERTGQLVDPLEPAGALETERGTRPLSFSEFTVAAAPARDQKPNFVVLDGPAGVGKTSLLLRLSHERGIRAVSAPILHVTSKGRRLSNLRDAISGTITSFRARFVPEEVPVLVRHGLLQVALDGFDEFVDEEGYRNAWAVLKDFIRECGSSGPLILSGRDTFFDQQQFLQQIGDAVSGASLTLVRLGPTSPNVARDWLARHGWSRADLDVPLTERYFQPGSFVLRPFYLSAVRPLKSWQPLVETGQSLAGFLTESVVSREANILAPAIGLSIEDVETALNGFFEDMAEDMADRESETVSKSYLPFLAEYSFQGRLKADVVKRLVHSIHSMVLVEQSEHTEDLRFPHTQVQSRYLARGLIRHLSEGRVPQYLQRAIFGTDRVEAFSDRLLEVPGEEASRSVVNLVSTLDLEASQSRISSNIVAMLISSLRRPEIWSGRLCIENRDAEEVRVTGVLAPAMLASVNMVRIDGANADFTEVDFQNCNIHTLVVDQTTRFGRSTPTVAVIQIKDAGQVQTLRSSHDVKKWLRRNSEIDAERSWDASLPLVKRFERICRRIIDQGTIRLTDEDPGSFLLRGDEWDEIKRILEPSGRLKQLEIVTSGRKSPFFTIEGPERFLSPDEADPESVDLRREIIGRARQLVGA